MPTFNESSQEFEISGNENTDCVDVIGKGQSMDQKGLPYILCMSKICFFLSITFDVIDVVLIPSGVPTRNI